MKPLGQDFFDLINWQAEISSIRETKGYLGLLIDSKAGDLRRSGLVSRPESVLTLDTLLTAKNAKIYYLNPGPYSKETYAKAVTIFTSLVNDTVQTNFNPEPPYLIFTKPTNDNNHVWSVLEFDNRSTCMWFYNFKAFLNVKLSDEGTMTQGSSNKIYSECKSTMLDETLRSVVSNVISVLAN